MDKLKRLFVVVLFMSLIGSGEASAEGRMDFELTVDYVSKYVWRGQNLDDDSVFQSGFSAIYGDLTAGIWANLELTNINGNSGDFSEIDYSVDYSRVMPGVKGVEYSIGAIYYDFPGTKVKDTTELYWGLNFDLPLSPSVTFYHDVDEADGTYISLAVEHSIERIAELGADMPVGMQLGTSLGWGSASYNKYYWGTDQSKLNDLTLSLSFLTEIGGGWTLAPNLGYVTLLSDDIRATDVYRTDSDYFFVGINLSKRF